VADYNLGTARGKIDIDASGVDASLGSAAASTKSFQKSTDQASASLLGAGKVIGGVGIALAAGLGLAVKMGADFEKRISAVGAVSGATGDELNLLREKALQLGADTAFSAGESAMAMEELVKAGLSVEDVLNGAADATVNLAAAGEVDLPKAAEIAANSMNQFGLSAEKMPRVADLIAGAANASAISVEDFGMSLSQAGAVANLAGLSFDDTAVAIAAMGNAGIKGSDAGTSLKTMLGNLQPQTEKQAEAMKALGAITEDGTNLFYDQEGSVKSLAEISEVLRKGTEGMTDAQKQATLEIAFGSDAIRAAAVFANEGAAGVNNLTEAMGKVTAADVAAKRMDNLSGSIEQLKGSFETLMINMGSAFQGPIRSLVDALTGLLNKFNELSPSAQKTIGLIVAGAAGILTAAGAFLATAGAVLKLAATAQVLGAALLANPIILVAAAVIALGAALTYAYFKFKSFRKIVDQVFDGFQALFGPLVETVVNFADRARTSLKFLFDIFKEGKLNADNFAAVMDHLLGGSGKFEEFFRNLYIGASFTFNWIKDNVVPIVERVVESLGGMGNILKFVGIAIAAMLFPLPAFIAGLVLAYQKVDWFRSGVDTAFRLIGSAVSFLVDLVQSAMPTIREVLENARIGFEWLATEVWERVGPAFEWLKTNVGPIMTSMGELISAVVTKITTAWNTLWPVFQFIGNLIMTVLVPLFLSAFGIIKEAVTSFVEAGIALWNEYGDEITTIWNFIVDVIEAALKVINGIITLATGILSGDWSKVWEGIKMILDGAWKFIKSVVSTSVSVMQGLISSAMGAVRGVWSSAWNLVVSTLSGAWTSMRNTVSSVGGSIVSFVASLPGRFVSALGGLLNLLVGKGSDLMTGMLNGIERIWKNIYSFVTGIPGKIISAVGDLGQTLYNAGKDVIQGLIDGIEDMIGSLTGVLGGITEMMPIKKGPPARDKVLLYENGQLIMAGLINGMKSVIPELEANLGGLTATIPGMVGAPMASSAGSSGTTLNLYFQGTFGPGAEDAIRKTVNDPTLLGQIITAAKAGAGG